MGKHGVICLSNNQKGTNVLGWAHYVEKVASKQSVYSFSGTGGLPEHFEPNHSFINQMASKFLTSSKWRSKL